MRNLSFLILGTCLVLLFSSCDSDEDIFGCIKGNGDVDSREFFLADFTGVKLEGVGDVYISYGTEQKVIVETDENLMELLETHVHDGLWTIDFDHCIKKITELNIYITLPEIDRVILSGSGSIYGEDNFQGVDLEVILDGSGSIEFEFTGNNVDANLTGSGIIELFGATDFLDINLSGSGDVRAFEMPADECEVYISGSGDASVNVEDYLKVRISGSGDVLYKGFPQLDVDITGSGSVLNRN